MAQRFDPEAIDLAEVTRLLRAACGPAVEGTAVGRTRLRDEVVLRLGCSELEGEQLIDTLIARGLLVQRAEPDGPAVWLIGEA